MKKIICIVGPTGCGKTGFSIELAEFLEEKSLKTHIINADSRQVYSDFPIITAQPTQEERKNIAHFLYGILESEKKCSVGLWLDMVHKEIERAYSVGAVPVLVGGTGMYIKALTEGIAQIPSIPSEVSLLIAQELQRNNLEYMYKKLQVIDEDYAKKIHKNDKQRICRALEVHEHTAKSITLWHKEAQEKSKYTSFKLGIGIPLSPIDELNPYLIQRTSKMLGEGAIEEAQKAYEQCADLTAPGWSGIGCIELGKYLLGEFDLDTALDEWNKNTRAYAKRQWTWFRGDKNMDWCHPLDSEKRKSFIDKLYKFIAN